MSLRFFQLEEFDCTHTGRNEMREAFLAKLDELRFRCAFPFYITSGFRDPSHPVEAKKPKPGRHCEGIAADIRAMSGYQKFKIIKHALELGFTGIGVAQTYVHVDTRESLPVIWTY